MPRKRLPPRLYLDPSRKQWSIRDGEKFVRTGFAEQDRGSAESLLIEYLKAQQAAAVPDRPSFVYFIECGDYIKIGYAASLQQRFSSLAMATPYPLKVLATMDGDRHTEGALQTRFAGAFHKGEWFRKTAELLAYIDGINDVRRAA